MVSKRKRECYVLYPENTDYLSFGSQLQVIRRLPSLIYLFLATHLALRLLKEEFFLNAKRFCEGILSIFQLKYIFYPISDPLPTLPTYVCTSMQLCAEREDLLIKDLIVYFLMSVFWCILLMCGFIAFQCTQYFSWEGIRKKK